MEGAEKAFCAATGHSLQSQDWTAGLMIATAHLCQTESGQSETSLFSPSLQTCCFELVINLKKENRKGSWRKRLIIHLRKHRRKVLFGFLSHKKIFLGPQATSLWAIYSLFDVHTTTLKSRTLSPSQEKMGRNHKPKKPFKCINNKQYCRKIKMNNSDQHYHQIKNQHIKIKDLLVKL